MIVEYVIKVEFVVTLISLFTMFVLMILNVTVPRSLIWVFATSLLFTILFTLFLRWNKRKYLE